MRSKIIATTLLAPFAFGGFAGADTGTCIDIVYQPPTVTITQPGVYCLQGPIAANLASRPAINIRASNVVVDLNGHKMGNLAAGTETRAIAVLATGRRNITVRNGIIRGFGTGVLIQPGSSGAVDSTGHIVENLTIERARIRGIDLRGTESTVRNNRIYITGDAPDTVTGLPRAGISIVGDNSSVVGNEVYDTHEPPENLGGIGILVQAADSAFVSGNRIANSGLIAPKTVGIEVSVGNGIVNDNQISGVDIGILYSTATGIYARNLIDRVALGAFGGLDGGGNVVRLVP